MTVPAFSLYSGRPRVFFRDTDLSTLIARSNDVNGWKTLWDNVIIPAANNYDDDADSSIGGRGDPGRFLVLALAGLIEDNSTYRNKAITAAVWLADNNPPNPTNTSGREVLLCLTIVFDLLYNYMTSTQRTTIANEIVYWCSGPVPGEGGMSANNAEWMDGHSGIDQMHQLAGALAIHGFHSQATTLLNESMNFIFGTGPNQGRIEMARYQYTGGGAEKGATYFQLGCRAELGYLYFLKNATTLTSIWTTEDAWASKIWEWVLWTQWRGSDSKTYEAHGDTGKISSPLFHMELRWIIAMLATQYAGVNGGKYMRWLFDEYVDLDNDFADNQIFDFLFLDRANTTALAPSTTPPATSKMFFPPGTYMFRGAASGDNAWNYQQSVTARVNARKWYWQGHFHLDSGSVQIVYKGDPLLLSPAGAYELTICSTCHNNNALQRSWLQSLVPLVLDPSQVYHKGNPSVSTNLSVNDGGQHYQKWVGSGGTEYDPNNVYKMQNDAGGQAWLRCESFTEIVNDASVSFISANIRNGYRKYITDSHRCPTLKVKYLFIRPTVNNGLTHWAMLYYARIVKADPDWVTQIPIHTYGAITTTAYGAHWLGYRGVNALSPAGKLWLDIRNISAYTRTNNTPGTITNTWGANQFKIGGTGTNYVPTGASSALELQDIKKHSLYVKKTTQVTEEHYVMLFMPTASNASEPASDRVWVTDGAQPNHYGITLNGTETYLVHRTLDEVVYPGAAADTTPPAEATSVVLTPKNTALLTTWTDPSDGDLDHIEVWRRTSAV